MACRYAFGRYRYTYCCLYTFKSNEPGVVDPHLFPLKSDLDSWVCVCVVGSEVSTAGPSHYSRGEGHSSNPNSPSESDIDMDEAGPSTRAHQGWNIIFLTLSLGTVIGSK